MANRSLVLVGGQAVALWASQLTDRFAIELEQVASKDIDFLATPDDAQRAAELLDAEVTLADGWEDRMNPLAGVALFLDGNHHPRRLDFLRRVHGLDTDDIRDTAIEVDVQVDEHVIALWVMHPHRCLESRVRNTELPNKQTALATRQLEASILCARAFSELLIDHAGDAGLVAARELNERSFRLAHHSTSLRLFREHRIDVTRAVTEDERLPAAHLQRRLPRLRAALERARQA